MSDLACAWACKTCKQHGTVTVTAIYRRKDETDAAVLQRFSRQCRESCAQQCAYTVTPLEPA